MRLFGRVLIAALAAGVSPAAMAQISTEVPPPAQPDEMAEGEDEPVDDIVVTGARERGAVVGNVKPEQQLNAADIRSYAVSSIAELITELAPQTNAAGGAPVILLNGKRISAFAEIQDMPPEAIERVDILPEEVALSYGYAANQKVVNIVLRRRFRAETAELRAGTTTDGGRENGKVEAGLLRIRNDNRFNLDLEYSRATRLLENERGITAAAPARPFSLTGNITALDGDSEIDPALSALAGEPVTVVAVPGSASRGTPALAAFVPGANQTSVSDVGRFRTLSPSTQNLAVNAVLARPLGNGISASVNARFEIIDSDSLQGLPGASLQLPSGSPFSPFADTTQLYRYIDTAGPLGQSTRGRTGHVGVALNGQISTWQWSFTGAYDISESKTRTDRGIDTGALQAAILAGDPTVNPYGVIPAALLGDTMVDRAQSTTSGLVGDLLLTGALFTLPAGKATTSVRVGASSNDVESRSVRSGVERDADFARDIVSGQVNIDLPITSRRNGVLGAIGDFALNANAAVEHLSDAGTLNTYGYGLRWTPITQIRLIASRTHDQNAPTGQQINAPQIVTPNVPIFDYARGETVFVSQIGGGNPLLTESERTVTRVGLTVKPFDKPDLTLTATYIDRRTDNPIAAFPTPTPQIEAAFPDRFLRDADGTLIQVDGRPINFASARSSQLRWGFNLSVPLKSAIQKKIEAWRAAGANREEMPAELRAIMGNRQRERSPEGQLPPNQADRERGGQGEAQGGGGPGGPGGPGGGGGGRRFGGGFGGRGGGGGGGRLQFALFHTWHFVERIEIDPSLPALDLLDGDATGSSGGQPRHELQGQFGYSNNGLGARMSVEWQNATRVDGALGGNGTTLRFGDLATVDLRLFANLGQIPTLVQKHPFLRGARVSLSIDNLFNQRQSVVDENGATPVRYQPAYLDPLGRTLSINFRKLF